MPDVLFTLSQTPTPGNKNIVGFIHIIFLFVIKMTESLNRERESTSFCSHITAILAIYQALAGGSLEWEDLISDTQVHRRLPLPSQGSALQAATLGFLLYCASFDDLNHF